MAISTLTWLDLTAADRDKVRQVLDLFNEQGTVDELGLSSLRDTISNALFPGTSVLHSGFATRCSFRGFTPKSSPRAPGGTLRADPLRE